MVSIRIQTFRIELKVALGPAESFHIYLNEFEKQIELDRCLLFTLDKHFTTCPVHCSHITKQRRSFLNLMNHLCSR